MLCSLECFILQEICFLYCKIHNTFCIQDTHLLFCQVYLYYKKCACYFFSTSCISNINRYQQKISLGIGQMSILLWAKNISGNKLFHEKKFTKNSKRKLNFLHTFIWQKFRFCKRWPAFTFPELTTQEKTQIRKNLQCNLKFGNLILPYKGRGWK